MGDTSSTGRQFEEQVAQCYRQMGACTVEHDKPIAGNQIDVYVEFEMFRGSLHRLAVECKDYGKSVGIGLVNDWAMVVDLLRRAHLVDSGVLVARQGFTRQARDAADTHHIRLLTLKDLQAWASSAEAKLPATQRSWEDIQAVAPPSPNGRQIIRVTKWLILLCLVVGFAIIPLQIATRGHSPLLAWAMRTRTSTPPTPQFSVEAFLITKGNSPTVTVKPDTTITATVREIVQVQAEVSVAYKEQEQDLVFIWHTCKTGINPVLQRIGNSEILYIAPSEPGTDCIVVVVEKVEKGGVLLGKSEIFVDVQE